MSSSRAAAFDRAEESNFTRFDVDDALGKRQFLTTRALIQHASGGAKIIAEEKGAGLRLTIYHAERRARRAAAVYIFYRISIDQANIPRGGFRQELLDNSLARTVFLPERYSLRAVRDAFFKHSAVYSKSKQLGVLIDVTSLDDLRTIRLLSTNPSEREAMLHWIIASADATLAPSAQPVAPAYPVLNPHAEATLSAPAPLPTAASLSDRLGHRTLATLVDAGFDASRASLVVASLADKGDVQAAMNKMLDDSYVSVAITPIVVAAAEEAVSDLSDATTALGMASPEASPADNQKLAVAPGEPPEDFVCPITQELMVEPVIAADGHTYEKAAILCWLANKMTSPKSGVPLETTAVFPNHLLRRQIREWQEEAHRV